MAWQAPKAVGHWEGSIKGPNQNVAITVDLTQDRTGGWAGALGMPAQGAKDIPLSGITVQGSAVHFSMFDAPGSPVFDGKVSEDGSAISGVLSGGGESTAFELKRTGEAKVEPPRASTQLSTDFEGPWQGTLGDGNRQLQLALTLTRAPDGTGKGALTTVGQGSPDLPITTITQKENRLEFEIRAIGGSYAGTLSGDHAQISGEWTQAGQSTPLVFKRAAEPKK
jgi:hypothetical protein